MPNDESDGITRGLRRRLVATGKIAVSAGRLAARRLVGAEGAQDRVLGDALARELDQMKGMAMKVGQIVSYFDGILPDDAHEALRSLQRGAQPVAFEQMAAVVHAAFGEPVDSLFEDFSRQPIASASIGQVYRAKYQGQQVAVKVQYPGIRDTISGDFSRLGAIADLASMATAVDGAAIVSELRERFVEECNYEREASNQELFRRAFADDERIHIPATVAARTRSTVLTSAWCEGDDFYAFASRADADRRNDVGLLMARFAYRSLFGLGMLNADPHPGNYLFPADQRTVFLDFGCVRHFEPEFLEQHRRLARVVINDDRAGFRDALHGTGMVAVEHGFDHDFHWKMLCHEYAPYRSSRFKFTREYLQVGLAFSKPTNPNLRKLRIPPQWIWMERLQWGLHAVLARLHAEGPFADVFRGALEGE